MKRNIKLILEYDGANYHGWQSQEGTGRPTIQDTLERAIRTLAKDEPRTYSSGRTDAGVHAYGHVVNFHTECSIPPAAWAPALNHALPDDIRVLTSEEVSADFHARYSAQGKIYQYRILNRTAPTALHRGRAWHIPKELDLSAMRQGADHLLGTHDFSAFRSSGCGAKTQIRTLRDITIRTNEGFVEITLEADAFLMHMARNIVGTLVEVGLGGRPAESTKQILASCDRCRAGRIAPAYGLYLVKVFYS